MKRLLQILIVISIGVALAALAGFLWRFVGYSLSEAFNPLFPHPEDVEAKRQSYLWGICFLAASAVTFRLFQAYRQNHRRK
jgi:predicted membrane-bound mannosyltransferase